MEDQVPFKVYTYWAENTKPEVRRFGVERSVVSSYQYLNAKLQEAFPRLKQSVCMYTVNWNDEDGDYVAISSDEELMIALSSMETSPCKLYVYCKERELQDVPCDVFISTTFPEVTATTSSGNVDHFGVTCDGCESSVVGFRYKCAVCDDFDLCSSCEAAGKHPEHCMVRIPAPTLPHQIIKAALKRSRRFLKTVADATANARQECPYKKQRGERGDRKFHGHGDHHAHHRERRQRGSWLETFATYMNEFANLAGDVGLDTENTSAAPKTGTQAKSAGQNEPAGSNVTSGPNVAQEPNIAQSTPGQSQSQNTQTESSAGTQAKPESTTQTQCPFVMPENFNLENVNKLFEMFMNGRMNPHAFTMAPDNDVEMRQADRQTGENSSVRSQASTSSASSKRDESPDKADDWTVINKEKDLMDSYVKASAPVEPTQPIGFNLPEEFQRVNIAGGQTLYPPLNAATAVLNPQDVMPSQVPVQGRSEQADFSVPAQPMSTPTQPKPTPAQPKPTPAQPKPTPAQSQPAPASANQPKPPRPRHPQAHIDAAIEHMLAMGFTNEGGWLTQLLESQDGNIAAVLELLTPVPKTF